MHISAMFQWPLIRGTYVTPILALSACFLCLFCAYTVPKFHKKIRYKPAQCTCYRRDHFRDVQPTVQIH